MGVGEEIQSMEEIIHLGIILRFDLKHNFFLTHFDVNCDPRGRRVIVKFVSLMSLCAFSKSQGNCLNLKHGQRL